MPHPLQSTPSATIRARIVLGLWIAATCFFIGVTFSPLKSGFADAPDRGPGDIALYRAEIDRIHAGESYYTAANAELRTRGYPTRSIFNWRTPLPMWFVGKLPEVALGKAFLGTAAIALLLLTFGLIADESNTRTGGLAALFLSGAILPVALGDLFVMTELWSGIFLAISAVAYSSGRRTCSVLAGIGALFLRELAAPYCLLMFAMAIWQRRRREATAWLVGIAVYAVYYAIHLKHVLPLIQPGDVAHSNGWVCFGGAGFVLSAVQMNTYLLLLPQWASAVFLTAALLGFASWNSAAGQRIGMTVALYLIGFSIVGQPINQYWGSMIAPMLCLGAALFPAALMDLLRTARWNLDNFRAATVRAVPVSKS
jgi:hypothetical protein